MNIAYMGVRKRWLEKQPEVMNGALRIVTSAAGITLEAADDPSQVFTTFEAAKGFIKSNAGLSTSFNFGRGSNFRGAPGLIANVAESLIKSGAAENVVFREYKTSVGLDRVKEIYGGSAFILPDSESTKVFQVIKNGEALNSVDTMRALGDAYGGLEIGGNLDKLTKRLRGFMTKKDIEVMPDNPIKVSLMDDSFGMNIKGVLDKVYNDEVQRGIEQIRMERGVVTPDDIRAVQKRAGEIARKGAATVASQASDGVSRAGRGFFETVRDSLEKEARRIQLSMMDSEGAASIESGKAYETVQEKIREINLALEGKVKHDYYDSEVGTMIKGSKKADGPIQIRNIRLSGDLDFSQLDKDIIRRMDTHTKRLFNNSNMSVAEFVNVLSPGILERMEKNNPLLARIVKQRRDLSKLSFGGTLKGNAILSLDETIEGNAIFVDPANITKEVGSKKSILTLSTSFGTDNPVFDLQTLASNKALFDDDMLEGLIESRLKEYDKIINETLKTPGVFSIDDYGKRIMGDSLSDTPGKVVGPKEAQGVIKMLEDMADSPNKDTARAARAALDFLGSGRALSDDPNLYAKTVKNLMGEFARKGGDFLQLDMPDSVSGEILPQYAIKNNESIAAKVGRAKPGFVTYIKGVGIVANEADVPELYPQLGGFDMDDTVISSIRWMDDKDGSLRLVAPVMRRPNARGELGVLQFSKNDDIVSLVMGKAAERDDAIGKAVRDSAYNDIRKNLRQGEKEMSVLTSRLERMWGNPKVHPSEIHSLERRVEALAVMLERERRNLDTVLRTTIKKAPDKMPSVRKVGEFINRSDEDYMIDGRVSSLGRSRGLVGVGEQIDGYTVTQMVDPSSGRINVTDVSSRYKMAAGSVEEFSYYEQYLTPDGWKQSDSFQRMIRFSDGVKSPGVDNVVIGNLAKALDSRDEEKILNILSSLELDAGEDGLLGRAINNRDFANAFIQSNREALESNEETRRLIGKVVDFETEDLVDAVIQTGVDKNKANVIEQAMKDSMEAVSQLMNAAQEQGLDLKFDRGYLTNSFDEYGNKIKSAKVNEKHLSTNLEDVLGEGFYEKLKQGAVQIRGMGEEAIKGTTLPEALIRGEVASDIRGSKRATDDARILQARMRDSARKISSMLGDSATNAEFFELMGTDFLLAYSEMFQEGTESTRARRAVIRYLQMNSDNPGLAFGNVSSLSKIDGVWNNILSYAEGGNIDQSRSLTTRQISRQTKILGSQQIEPLLGEMLEGSRVSRGFLNAMLSGSVLGEEYLDEDMARALHGAGFVGVDPDSRFRGLIDPLTAFDPRIETPDGTTINNLGELFYEYNNAGNRVQYKTLLADRFRSSMEQAYDLFTKEALTEGSEAMSPGLMDYMRKSIGDGLEPGSKAAEQLRKAMDGAVEVTEGITQKRGLPAFARDLWNSVGSFKPAVLAAGAAVAAAGVLRSARGANDRSLDEMQGPGFLPGGNPYSDEEQQGPQLDYQAMSPGLAPPVSAGQGGSRYIVRTSGMDPGQGFLRLVASVTGASNGTYLEQREIPGFQGDVARQRILSQY